MHTNTTNTKTGREMAAEYADGIVDELSALDTLAQFWDDIDNYVQAVKDDEDAETVAELRDEAEAAAGGPEALAEVLRLHRELNVSDGCDVADAWFADLLDVEARGIYRDGEWQVEEVAALVTFGGPSARVVWDGSGTLAVRVSWWSEEVVRRVECDALAAEFETIAEAVNA